MGLWSAIKSALSDDTLGSAVDGFGGSGVTSVTASAPMLSSGGATPNLSMPAATDLVDGYLSATTQSIGGDKDFKGNCTFDGDLIINRSLTFTPLINNTLTGSNADIAYHSQDYTIVTNASLTSIASIANTVIAEGHIVNILNQTGTPITIVHNFGSPPVGSAKILSPSGEDIIIPNYGSVSMIYQTNGGIAWRVQLATQDVATKTYVSNSVFASSEQTGTGSPQNIAHGLGTTPSKVLISITDNTAGTGKFTITEGTHDSTDVIVTVDSGYKYKVLAFR